MPKCFLPVVAALLALATDARACAACRPKVQAAIHDPHYAATALLVLLPVLLLIGGGLLLYFAPSFSPTTPWKTAPLRPAAPTARR